MGGGCSTKRSISVNDAGAKVNLKKNQEESRDDLDDSKTGNKKLNIKKKSKCTRLSKL